MWKKYEEEIYTENINIILNNFEKTEKNQINIFKKVCWGKR